MIKDMSDPITFILIGHILTNLILLNVKNHRKIEQNPTNNKDAFKELCIIF